MAQLGTVLVTASHLAPEAEAMLREAGAVVEFMTEPIGAQQLAARLGRGDVTAVLLRGSKPLDADVLAAARGLKVIAKNGAGVDSVDLDAAMQRGIKVAVAAGANADAVAEHALALMLALVRGLPTLDAHVRRGQWANAQYQGRDFRGSRVGIVGFGSIGQATAVLANALGGQVSVLGSSERQRAAAKQLGFALCDSLLAMLPDIDILSLHCPLNERTRGLIGKSELQAMPRGSFLVNTARGPVVDQAALVAALQSGHLAGAGIDTFEKEPLPQDDALVAVQNAILTPHVAGVTRNAALRVATVTAQNIIDVLAGRALPPLHCVV